MKFHEIAEECKNIYTELSYNSRWVRIAMFHLLGRTLIENDFDYEKTRSMANMIGISFDDLAFAIAFAEKYPNLDDFPHDKSINWSQIKNILNEENKET